MPISFLEALSFGTLLVSNRNPEELTSKFGIHVGDVLGDGFEKVHLYIEAIESLMENEEQRHLLAIQARKYIEKYHNVADFTKKLRNILLKEVKS